MTYLGLFFTRLREELSKVLGEEYHVQITGGGGTNPDEVFVGYKMDSRGNNKLPNQTWWLQIKEGKFFMTYRGYHLDGGMHHEELYMDMEDPNFCVEKIAGTINYLRVHR